MVRLRSNLLLGGVTASAPEVGELSAMLRKHLTIAANGNKQQQQPQSTVVVFNPVRPVQMQPAVMNAFFGTAPAPSATVVDDSEQPRHQQQQQEDRDGDGDQIMGDDDRGDFVPPSAAPPAAAAAATAPQSRPLKEIARHLIPELCVITHASSITGPILGAITNITSYKKMLEEIRQRVANAHDPARSAVERISSVHMGTDDYARLKQSVEKLNEFMQRNSRGLDFDNMLTHCINILGVINGTLLHADRGAALYDEFMARLDELAEADGQTDEANAEITAAAVIEFAERAQGEDASGDTAREFLSRYAAEILLKREYAAITGIRNEQGM
jgi:hypothetical protein